ncbi:sigma-70 family RNA polymerase sigma factor [Nocardia seriolae]|uniref:ECF RNA polymerase sigma factor SigW n=2 Tax=Nocardia seriolae TaxID=37332 RepID=A0ABC8ARP4_9NOCA|nr:sigma-70 family RNA polymerase sigma factor [Nocardia seriolae]APA96821.1 ECF RNA polymerase sigma factor SigW [Nocardia seriolae]PSK26600.1 RNA polymerase subunit sigma-70 [Nocardia seriolae]QOW33869.1 sigma-70 family RNA polymerase sigma factor [Nocardia seriolae]WNJ61069.1 sigma-70 family RNA polymerase sigma factor [Nocardia seriolae]BEK97806.1 sigma-70 family RNA polymerase sigma factor [Nocardia seriolae]
MSDISFTEVPDEVAVARAGDDAAFTRLIAPMRRELHAHCYRMLGSTHDAEDALQDALLRAWRGFAGYEGRSSLRRWLYAVATNTCLDLIARRAKRALPMDLGPASEHAVLDNEPRIEVPWLSPYPDTGLAYEQREAVELAFVAALQHLPGNQRAALLLFDVLGYTAAEIAEVMDTSVTSVNSALARARKLMADKTREQTQQQTLRALGDARLRELVTAYATAFERRDAPALIALVTEDVTWSMPPLPHWYRGRAAALDFATQIPMGTCPAWRHLHTTANGQPAVALYLWHAATHTYRPWAISVLTLRGNQIAAITSFIGPTLFPDFNLPDHLPEGLEHP